MKRQDILISVCLIFGLLCPVSAKSLSSEKIVFSSNRDGNSNLRYINASTNSVKSRTVTSG